MPPFSKYCFILCAVCVIGILVILITNISFDSEQTDKGDTKEAGELAVMDKLGNGVIEDFVPTNEWQKIKKGQAIPAGLHIRMNLETGENEAKLMDTKSASGDKEKAVVLVEKPAQEKELIFGQTKEQLKHLLSRIKDDSANINETNEALKKFRSYDELKRELESVNLTPKSDPETMGILVDDFCGEWSAMARLNSKSPNEIERRMKRISDIADDIEELVHKYDNGVEFAKSERINKALESFFTETPYTEGTVLCMRILGSAVQNNLQAQVKAVERNYVSAIIDILRKCPSANEQVVSTALYALSCLIRQYPVAQIEFVSADGALLLVKMIGSDHSIRNQLKAVRLLGDLITEESDVENTYGNKTEKGTPGSNATGDGVSENTPSLSSEIRNQTDINKLGLYRRAHIRETLLGLGWCDVLCMFLEENSVPDIEVKGHNPMKWGERGVNHELVQIVANAMISMANHCQFTVSPQHILALFDYYSMLARVDPDYEEMKTVTSELLESLRVPRTLIKY